MIDLFQKPDEYDKTELLDHISVMIHTSLPTVLASGA